MGPPSRQSETTVAPKMYCLIICGFTSASHTLAAGAAMLVEALAMSSWARKFSVSSAGTVSGTVACWTIPVCTSGPCPTVTCNVSGTLTPRTDLNAYDAVLSFGSTSGGATPMDGTYDGIAHYDTGTGRPHLAGISSATNHGIGFR